MFDQVLKISTKVHLQMVHCILDACIHDFKIKLLIGILL